jgi:hypothetical protein
MHKNIDIESVFSLLPLVTKVKKDSPLELMIAKGWWKLKPKFKIKWPTVKRSQ